MALNALIVGLGGFLGSAARYAVGQLVYRYSNYHWFPIGTLSVNIAGSFFIGLLSGLFEQKFPAPPEVKLFFITGCLGGFTTFSAFSYETLQLARMTDLGAWPFFSNIILHVVLCLVGVWLGMLCSRLIA